MPTSEEHLQFLAKLEDLDEISIWNGLHRNASVHVMLNQSKSPWLQPVFHSLEMEPTRMIADLQKLLDDEQRSLKAHPRSSALEDIFETFYDYDEFSAWLHKIADAYPSLATVSSIGKTHENRDIWLIKLGAGPKAGKKTVFMDFGMDSRDWITSATAAVIIHELLTNGVSEGDARLLLNTWEFHLVPIMNPDGYAYSHTKNRLWRKNRKPVVNNCFGVYLGRNFLYQWNNMGSLSPCSDTFPNGLPMTENEVKAMERYMTGKAWDAYLTFASYGQWWFTVDRANAVHLRGFTPNFPPNYNLSVRMAQIGADAIERVNGHKYTIGPSAKLLYISSGMSEDWSRGTLNIFHSYRLALPPIDGTGFIVPASDIRQTGDETYVGVAAFLKALYHEDIASVIG